jgi:hypothetical protein
MRAAGRTISTTIFRSEPKGFLFFLIKGPAGTSQALFFRKSGLAQSLGATESINPYSYAWNAPLNYVDPTGHSLLGIVGALRLARLLLRFGVE